MSIVGLQKKFIVKIISTYEANHFERIIKLDLFR